MKVDLSIWPRVDRAQVRLALRAVPLDAYPELAGYSRVEIYAGLAGQGGLFLASDMAKRLSLMRGMRVLDLGCGSGTTSLYLARTYGVTVYAADLELPADLLSRATAGGVADLVIPVRCDARSLPFSREFFDAVFTMNSFFYFGTEDFYPSYLMSFIKPQGELVIGCPCYREEITDDTPAEFLIEYPACLAVHSPTWWRRHFERNRACEVLHSALHPRGVEFWEDRVRFLIDEQSPTEMPEWRRRMVHDMIALLNRDTEGFVSHFILHAKRSQA
jgi:cyclopropane fatty-acyl-phospholipid synthase-like methyltransferase